MPTPGLSAAVARLGRAVAPDPPSDGRLLAAFAATRDEPAFAELVARHGPMVLAVCRKLTGHRQDAEDAFQAAFVVLARRAAEVKPRSVGGWLHGVAVRVAREARSMAARRRRREVSVPVLPEQPADAGRSPEAADDLGAVLHEELAALPDKYRTLLVLCDLEGQPQTAVAGQLGVPVGTVYSRLATARAALAARLRKRGVALSAAGLGVALAGAGQAAVLPDLAARAVAAVVSPQTIPAAVAALSDGVLRMMLVNKLKLVPVAAALLAGLVVAAAAGRADDPPKPAPEAVAAKPADPRPRPKALNKLLVLKAGHLVLIDPDGKNEKQLTANVAEFRPGVARLSPDGTAYATVIRVGNPEDLRPGELPRFKLYVRKLTDPEPGTDLGVEARGFCWSPDGTRLAVSEPAEAGGGEPNFNHSVVDIKTGKKSVLQLRPNLVVTDWAAGDKLITANPRAGLFRLNLDGTEDRRLTDAERPTGHAALSPDGERMLAFQPKQPAPKAPPPAPGAPPAVTQTLVVIEVATGEATPVDGYPDRTVMSRDFCWSPDGRRIAYVRHELAAAGAGNLAGTPTASHLVVCDPDGKNVKTVLSVLCNGSWRDVIGAPDWR